MAGQTVCIPDAGDSSARSQTTAKTTLHLLRSVEILHYPRRKTAVKPCVPGEHRLHPVVLISFPRVPLLTAVCLNFCSLLGVYRLGFALKLVSCNQNISLLTYLLTHLQLKCFTCSVSNSCSLATDMRVDLSPRLGGHTVANHPPPTTVLLDAPGYG